MEPLMNIPTIPNNLLTIRGNLDQTISLVEHDQVDLGQNQILQYTISVCLLHRTCSYPEWDMSAVRQHYVHLQ
ncbi:hypothetical protein O3M35_002837 [Rhynocoris fuscipes]|uniref:Uncharacterized protein n=1 Tax=Rhynocoris fuscipes TaxID=488301 RepID=A0AAW1CMW2_9HEMI